MPDFCHLHLHTQLSMLDGYGSIRDYVARGKALGMGFMGIMDHGNVSGIPEFYAECRANDIEPVLGEEFYFVPDAEAAKSDKNLERFHVGIIAKGERGFRVLSDLSTEGHRRFYGKPIIDRAVIEAMSKKDRQQLVVLSGCANSIISRKALHKIPGDANDELDWWNRMFRNFWIELMHHDTDFDRNLNRRLLRIARRHKLPWVVTNDPHYVMEDECGVHDALLAIQTASDIDDPNRFKFEGTGYHLRSAAEMRKAFKSYGSEVFRPGARATIEIAKACHVRIPALEAKSWHIPKFPRLPEGLDSNRYLKRLIGQGLRERGVHDNPKYIERARSELRDIERAGIADFLLITRDIIRFANRKGIRVGPGRGSICGCLAAYLIGVHKVDSVRYDLMFERFLNPDRPKAPDIDSDFDPEGRPQIFRYIERTYGAENVIRVANFTTMATKKAFQSIARAYGIDHLERNRLSSEIKMTEDGEAILPDTILENYPDLVETLEALTGVYSNISRHAAGVLILDPEDPVREIVPQMWVASSKQMVAQYNLASVENLRLLKQDILSLRNVLSIGVACRFIEERHGVHLEPDDWIPDEEPGDKKIYKMLGRGEVVGVFQMEGSANARGIQQIKPRSFEDIYNCTALYRKGPIMAGSDKRFLKNRKDRKVRVIHESLRPILESTWGEMIYDEQMFQILKDCAGFTWAQVDDAKNAMKKKNPALMAPLKKAAIRGFIKTVGMTKEQALKMWKVIEEQTAYLFNLSHAVAYSLVTYQTAKLKHDYPLEFMAALAATVDLDAETGKEKRLTYLGEAVRMGYEILPPDINISDIRAKPEGDSAIRLGLNDIKGIGWSMANLIVRRRNRAGGRFADLDAVYKAVNHKLAMEALSDSGALESVGRSCNDAKQDELLGWQFHDPLAEFRDRWSKKLKPPRGTNGNVVLCGELVRVDRKTTKNGKAYRTWKMRWRPGEEWTITVMDGAADLFDLKVGSIVACEGKWNTAYNNVAIWDSDDTRVLKAVRPA